MRRHHARCRSEPSRTHSFAVQTESILVVDDEAAVLDVLKVALKKAGFTTFPAGTVTEARALISSQLFACALIDKNLPDGSGLDVIRALRAAQPECTCIVMTAYPNSDSILEALKLGASDYLEKPFPSLSVVQEKVKNAVERQKRLAALSARVAEMSALKAAVDAAKAPADPRFEALQFRHQRALGLLREVKTELEKNNAAPGLLSRVAALLDELK